MAACLGLGLFGCTYDPGYGGVLCPDGACPEGYVCVLPRDEGKPFCTTNPGTDNCHYDPPDVQPGAAEVCDGLDNDCDDETDSEDAELVLAPCELTQGVCAGGYLHDAAECVDGHWQACDASDYGADFEPSEQLCDDDLDNDCDGATDCDDSTCDGYVAECRNHCHLGHRTCVEGVWSDCDAAPEESEGSHLGNCDDGLDNDCDGKTDGEEQDCCATVGRTGAMLLIFLMPFGFRRRLRKRPDPGEGSRTRTCSR